MEQQKQIRPDNKTTKVWKRHLQDEVDASFLYSVFAGLESDPKRKDILSGLAGVENRHVIRWREILATYDIKVKRQQPTLKARLMAWYARRFGSEFPLSQMLGEEANEVKDYLTLHRNSIRKDVKETALDLAKESAMHTESLQELTGTSGEPWHKTESGGMVGNIVYGFNDGLTANFGLVVWHHRCDIGCLHDSCDRYHWDGRGFTVDGGFRLPCREK